jgi:hypothetical protein
MLACPGRVRGWLLVNSSMTLPTLLSLDIGGQDYLAPSELSDDPLFGKSKTGTSSCLRLAEYLSNSVSLPMDATIAPQL